MDGPSQPDAVTQQQRIERRRELILFKTAQAVDRALRDVEEQEGLPNDHRMRRRIINLAVELMNSRLEWQL